MADPKLVLGLKEFVIHYDGGWGKLKAGEIRGSDYNGGEKMEIEMAGHEFCLEYLKTDVEELVGEGVIYLIDCIIDGFICRITHDAHMTHVWDELQPEKDKKYHLYVSQPPTPPTPKTETINPKSIPTTSVPSQNPKSTPTQKTKPVGTKKIKPKPMTPVRRSARLNRLITKPVLGPNGKPMVLEISDDDKSEEDAHDEVNISEDPILEDVVHEGNSEEDVVMPDSNVIESQLDPIDDDLCTQNIHAYIEELEAHVEDHMVDNTLDNSDLNRNIYEVEEMAKVVDPVVEEFGICELKPKMSWATVENFKKTFRGELWENLAWGAAEAYKVQEFTRILGVINKTDSKALDWLDREPRSCWARAHFDWTAKCDQLTNNFSESFNSWILHIRDKPCVCFIDQYNLDLLNLMYTRRELSMELLEGDVVPNVLFMIKKREMRYCSPYFSVEAFRQTYSNYLYPLDNIAEWPEIMKQHLDIKYQCNNKKPQCNNNLQVPEEEQHNSNKNKFKSKQQPKAKEGEEDQEVRLEEEEQRQQRTRTSSRASSSPKGKRGRGRPKTRGGIGARTRGERGARTRGERGVRGGGETPSTPPRNARESKHPWGREKEIAVESPTPYPHLYKSGYNNFGAQGRKICKDFIDEHLGCTQDEVRQHLSAVEGSKTLEKNKAILEKSKAALEKSKIALEKNKKSKAALLEQNKKAAIRVVVQARFRFVYVSRFRFATPKIRFVYVSLKYYVLQCVAVVLLRG
ncbi:hypothetical protein IFM89_002838 [Coptis chinensis]|uniref:Uncharacterized protein n=1 Tax=Coptis chinensis TaxID=261450 RepID=A0A835H414_9MAGN|nr:hypothetical protein IFM89_002838 [Coptis chinensis]